MTTKEEPALAGIRVLELAQMIAGPSAGLLLADYGAEDLKVEPPDGDTCRQLRSAAAGALADPPVFAGYNRGKRLVRIDLRSVAGRAEVLRLVDEADVLIETSRPGTMERLGLGADALLARNPRLIYASVSGFGHGPIGAPLGGVDIVVQAESGLMSTTGYPDGPPTKVGFTIIDAACGHALCHGIMAALLRRARTGRGDVVRISLYDVALHLQTGPLVEFLMTGVQPPRPGNAALLSAPADSFRCADGNAIISAYLEPHWKRFAELIGAPEMVDDPRFVTGPMRARNRPALVPMIEEKLRAKPVREWVALLRAEGLLAGQVKDYKDVMADPLTAETGLIQAVGDAYGVLNPVRMERTQAPPLQPRREEPASGEQVRFTSPNHPQ